MQERSIDGALLALRKKTIRENREGLAHVEALLVMRGVHMPRVLPAKRKDTARRGLMTKLVLEALADKPKPLRDVVAYVAANRPELDAKFAYGRTVRVLIKMKAKGQLCKDGCLWTIAEHP